MTECLIPEARLLSVVDMTLFPLILLRELFRVLIKIIFKENTDEH